MADLSDREYMSQALQLAKLGLYTTDPNPRVGCVIVRDKKIVGRGFHYKAGEPHAEPLALAEAGELARGATAYVTLEPCCHYGRTPPCTERLIEAGVSRVVMAMVDPNPLVAAEGMSQLLEAGIEVETGLLEAEAKVLNPGFIMRMTQGRPYVRCKLAMSLDGRTAMADGESKWITSDAARRDVHKLRARSSVLLSGIETVLQDDPSFNVRLDSSDLKGVKSDEDIRSPRRVILDSHLRISPNARMFNVPGESLVIGADIDENQERKAKLESQGINVELLAKSAKGLDLHAVMKYLAEQEANEVMIESGAKLAGAMLDAKLIDELVVYMAPHLMGDSARGLFHLPAVEQMNQRVNLEIQDIRKVGKDWRITAIPAD